MKKLLISLLTLSAGLSSFGAGQDARITSTPSPAVSNKPLEITITTGNLGGTVYCYSWCESVNGQSLAPSWQWGDVNNSRFQMSGDGGTYTFTISDLKTFYGLTDSQLEGLTKLGFIAKTASGSQTQDLFVEVVQGRRDAYSGGEGTAADPFVIKTSNDLSMLAATPSDWAAGTYFRLDADVDGSALTTTIGSVSTPFSGEFNGNGHTVSNLNLRGSGLGSATGLFGAVKGASITSLGVSAATVSGQTYAGLLAGYVQSGVIQRCWSTGKVTGNSICVGGLIGENIGGEIIDCYSGADVENPSDYATGGLVGKNRGTIRNTYSAGSVTGYDYVGGVVGANYGIVRNSLALNNGVTSYNDFAARFGGNNNGQNLVDGNFSWDGIVPGHQVWAAHGDHAEARSGADFQNEASFRSLTGWDLDNVWEWKEREGKGYPVLRGFANQNCPLSESYFSISSKVENINNGLEASITAGPNPTSGRLVIKAVEGVGDYAFYSMSGQLILSGSGGEAGEYGLDISSFANGIYLLVVSDMAGNAETFKIIKR